MRCFGRGRFSEGSISFVENNIEVARKPTVRGVVNAICFKIILKLLRNY